MVAFENRFPVPPRYWGVPFGIIGSCLGSLLFASVASLQGVLTFMHLLDIVLTVSGLVLPLSFFTFLGWDRFVPKRVIIGPDTVVGFLIWRSHGRLSKAVCTLPYSGVTGVSVRRHWLFSQIRFNSGTKVQDGKSQRWTGVLEVNHIVAAEVRSRWTSWKASEHSAAMPKNEVAVSSQPTFRTRSRP